MANDDKWDPTKPLDKDDEEEVQREAKARARLKHLEGEYLATVPTKTPAKKKKGLFRSDD